MEFAKKCKVSLHFFSRKFPAPPHSLNSIVHSYSGANSFRQKPSHLVLRIFLRDIEEISGTILIKTAE